MKVSQPVRPFLRKDKRDAIPAIQANGAGGTRGDETKRVGKCGAATAAYEVPPLSKGAANKRVSGE